MQRKIKWGLSSPPQAPPGSEDEGGENKTRGRLSPPPPPRGRKKTDIHKLKLHYELIHLSTGGEIIKNSFQCVRWGGGGGGVNSHKTSFIPPVEEPTVSDRTHCPLVSCENTGT